MFSMAIVQEKDFLDDPILRSPLVPQENVGLSDLFDGTGRFPQLPLYNPQANKPGPSPPSDSGNPLELNGLIWLIFNF